MRPSLFVVAFLALLVSMVPVSAVSMNGLAVAASKTPTAAAAAPVQDILPLSVHSSDSLSAIVATQKTTAAVLAREKQTYSEIQKKSLDVAASEQPVVQAQLSQQRYRYLLALTNGVVVIYQRIDYIISHLGESLLRLRTLYSDKGKIVADFDSRVRKLDADYAALESQSKAVAASLDAVKDSPDMVKSLHSARNAVSDLLSSLRSFLGEYRALAQDVVQA